KPIG
ncbi:hypothetical protein D039_4737B, partial [Vibrio parahaemolyticus EKP-028]